MPTAGDAPYPPVYEDSYASLPSPEPGVGPVDRGAGTEVFPAMLGGAPAPRSVQVAPAQTIAAVEPAQTYGRLDSSLQAQRQNVMANDVESYAAVDYATTNRRFPSGVAASVPAGQPPLRPEISASGPYVNAAPTSSAPTISALPPRIQVANSGYDRNRGSGNASMQPSPRRPSASARSMGPAPVTGSGDMIGVQVGAYRIQENADRGWSKVMDLYPNMLTSLVPVIVEVDLGAKGTYFRLIATGVDSVTNARALCDDLIIKGQDWCAVRRM